MSLAYQYPDDNPQYMTLQDIWQKHFDGEWPDKGSVHSYIDLYAQLFELRRYSAANILEIGVLSGQSIKMWTEYFSGDVYGIDYTLTPVDKYNLQPVIDAGYKVKIFDATNPYEAKRNFEGVRFDIIIDDAQHSIDQQLELYSVWKPYLTKDFIYVIEDIQDIDRDRGKFEGIDPEMKVEIFDLRDQKGRYDDVVCVIRPK